MTATTLEDIVEALTAIVSAVSAAAQGRSASTGAARAAYDALKQRLVQRFGAKAKVAVALSSVEEEPDSIEWQAVLRKELDRAGAGDDAELVRMAQKLLALLNREGQAAAHYEADVSGSGAVAQGDGAVAAGAGGIAVGRQRGNIYQGGRGSGHEDDDERGPRRDRAVDRKGFAHLPPEALDALAEAALSTELATAAGRANLFAAINPGFVAGVPVRDSPLAQIRSDLAQLNKVESLAAGEVPLLTWLRNGEAWLRLRGFETQRLKFQQAWEQLQKGAYRGELPDQ